MSTKDDSKKYTVSLIPGDGIGPEVVAATLRLIEATGVKIHWEEVSAGASVFRKGIATGVPNETVDSIRRTGLALKGPLETPVGFGEKSANVTLRKLFETYGNIRPIREIEGVPTPYTGRGVNLTIVRENVEDLYAGIEHMQTAEVAQCLKLISRKGCEKIVRLAFEVARAEGRKTVHCATKANIMKFTEGLLKRVFEEIAPEYPEIDSQHIIVDNCAHQLVKKPEQFGVIVTTNMNGDILSDLSSALVGGLGFAPSANIGSNTAIFEAVHGSAPKYAGKNVINPTAMMLSGVMLLRHLGELGAADLMEDAIDVTWAETGAKTRDVVGDLHSVGTTEYTEAVLRNFGKRPTKIIRPQYREVRLPKFTPQTGRVEIRERKVVGVDVFAESHLNPEEIGTKLRASTETSAFRLKMLSNRGTQVFPKTGGTTDTVDHYRCRFMWKTPAEELSAGDLDALLACFAQAGVRWMHIEKLQEFNGAAGYTKAQGED